MKKIMIVDDSRVITDLMKLMLEKSGYSCMTANKASDCLDMVRNEKFDLLLLDIGIPDISGLDLLDMIRNDEIYKDMKVALFTASSPTQSELESFMAKGVVGVIKKPVKKDILVAELEGYLAS